MVGRSISTILGLIIMTACSPQNDIALEQQRLLNTDRQFAAMSLTDGAGEAFNHYLDDNAMGLSQGQHPVFGRDSLYTSMKDGQETYTLEWDPQRAEVAASMDMGWTWGTYVLSFDDAEGVLQKRYGKYLNIWKRQSDGQWRVLVDMGNSSPPPEEVSSENL